MQTDAPAFAIVHKDHPAEPVSLAGRPMTGRKNTVLHAFREATGWTQTEATRLGFSLVPLADLPSPPARPGTP